MSVIIESGVCHLVYIVYIGGAIYNICYTRQGTQDRTIADSLRGDPLSCCPPPPYADLLCNIYTHEAGTDKCHRSLTRHPCVEAESRDRGTARIIIFCCHSYYILCTGGLFGVYFYKFGMRTSSAFTNDRCILL